MKDITLDDTDDLQIINNDFVIGDSDQQHVYCVVKSSIGDFREFPLIGANLSEIVNSNISPVELRNRIKLALEADQWRLKSIFNNNGNIKVIATEL